MAAFGTWMRARLGIVTYSKQDQGTFRIGHSYSEETIRKVSRRDDVGYFYTSAIVDMAFKDGFQIEDGNDVRVDALSDELQDLGWLAEIIRGAADERKDGSVTFVLFDEGHLMSFKQEDTKFRIDKYGEFTAFKLKEKIGGANMPLQHFAGDVEQFEGGSEVLLEDIGNLDDIFHEVLRPDEYRYQGISALEPILDIINTRRIIIGAIGIHATRKAAGLRVATIEQRQDPTKDAVVMTNVEMGIARLESDDMSVILRSGYDPSTNQKWEDKFDILDTDNYNFLMKMEVCHRALSTATGIPVNYWNGIFQGATVGAPAVLELLYAKFQSIQDSWTRRIEKMAQRWCEISGQAWNDDWHPVWNLRPKLTEKEEAEIEQIQATTRATHKNAGILSVPEIREDMGQENPDKVIKNPDIAIEVEGLDDPPTTTEPTEEEPIPTEE
ncbi:hypothetical protein LCGC14_1381750 [marine sediment metagenome]|uniref:Uncharacterized protein n=1 Tax=marine sediment metagenome TaxID=412755 RepID=A0A0F9MHZ6_9ZZZZ